MRNNAQFFICENCHTLIYGLSIDPSLQGGIGVNANNVEVVRGGVAPDSFKPVRHIWYQHRQQDWGDKLPKYHDSPKDQGGTGQYWGETISRNQ